MAIAQDKPTRRPATLRTWFGRLARSEHRLRQSWHAAARGEPDGREQMRLYARRVAEAAEAIEAIAASAAETPPPPTRRRKSMAIELDGVPTSITEAVVCPACGCRETVHEKKILENEFAVTRRRRCKGCGAHFPAIETFEPLFDRGNPEIGKTLSSLVTLMHSAKPKGSKHDRERSPEISR